MQLADFFGVNESTLTRWKKRYPELRTSLKDGKDKTDAEVAESLLHRALGYSHPEDKIFLHEGKPVIVSTTKHYPPDATSMIFWLKNRQREAWKDRHDVDHTGEVKVERIERVIVDEQGLQPVLDTTARVVNETATGPDKPTMQ